MNPLFIFSVILNNLIALSLCFNAKFFDAAIEKLIYDFIKLSWPHGYKCDFEALILDVNCVVLDVHQRP